MRGDYKGQYFEGVSKAVWEYQIGGYQVLDNYLMDKEGRKLLLVEIEQYIRVAKAIERTIEVQGEVEIVFWVGCGSERIGAFF